MTSHETPRRIVALSDVHEDIEGIHSLGRVLACADLVLLVGDITRNGGRTAARNVVGAVRAHASRILAIHGNCDRREALEYLQEEGISLHRTARRLGDLAMFGVGGSNPTPMRTPSEYSEEQLGEFLMEAAGETKDAPLRMAVVHAPPRESRLDRMFLGLHVGSRAFRQFLRSDEPDIAVSGHIHESPAAQRLGQTLCVNPGGFVGHWRYAEIRVDGMSVAAELRQAEQFPSRLRRAARFVRRTLS